MTSKDPPSPSTDAFIRAELQRVAPEFSSEELRLDSGVYSARKGQPDRAKGYEGTFLYDKDRASGGPIRTIDITGTPLSQGRETEVRVFTGHIKYVHPARAENSSVVVPQVLDRKLHRRTVYRN